MNATHGTGNGPFQIPGTGARLLIERSPEGRLLRMEAANRVYLTSPGPGSYCFDGGLVSTEQIEMPFGMLRRVTALSQTWTEVYRWDDKGLLIEVDGVQVTYDCEGRVTSCRGEGGSWSYAYSAAQLSVISTPWDFRRITRDDTGRPIAYSQAGRLVRIGYDSSGRRTQRPNPLSGWHFDQCGRLWTVTDNSGRIVLTYLWEGRHCICAIAGAPGEPLSQVYSLDPTGTPVRVITRDRMMRVPRDAFGEALLQAPTVPALFCGAVADGMVHLPYRWLDPLTGSFDAPDPFDGEQQDPRRASGWTGPLKIELPAAGPYTVCRHNPVSLADPTGAISDLWWAIPSALTWSMQNTIASLLGMWFGLDFSPIGMLIAAATGGRPFDIEWVKATNFDMFALRTDGWTAMAFNAPNAFTYQFFMSQQGPAYRTLDEARLFIPDDAFRPTLYGSYLHFTPASSATFITRGQRRAPNGTTTLNGTAAITNWSRSGGIAEAAFPGSKLPVFPRGGLHFDTIQANVTQQACTATEIVPGPVALFGSPATTSALQVPGTGLGINNNDSLLLTDSAGIVEIVHALNVHEASPSTTITIDSPGTRLSTSPITLNGLSAQIGTESLAPVDGNQTLLSIAGSSKDYHPAGTVVRLSRSNAVVHFARVTALEARLSLNTALPASLGNTLKVRPATAPGNFNGRIQSATSFRVLSGAVPGNGTGLTVGPAATAIPAIVTNVAGAVVTLDTDFSSLGAAGKNVNWRPLAPSAPIGTRSGAPETDPKLTYTPDLSGTVPVVATTPFVQVDGIGSAVRRIVAVDYDAIVMSQPRPDVALTPYSVDRFTVGALNVQGVTLGASVVLGVNTPPPPDVRAFEVVQYTTPTVTAGTAIVTGAAVNGSTATTVADPTKAALGLQVSQVVVVTPASGPLQAAAIRRLRLTVTLDRTLSLSSDGLQAALLQGDVLIYTAVRKADRQIRVRPIIAGAAGPRVAMPRFRSGELVQIDFSSVIAGGVQQRVARVESVSGSTITYSADEKVVQSDAANLTVRRLVALDSGNGSARVGIDGKFTAPNKIEYSVWQISDFGNTPIVALIDGATVFAAKITKDLQPLSIEMAIGTVTGPVTVSEPPARSGSGISLRFTSDAATIQFDDGPLGGAAGAGFIVAVPYIDAPATITGKLDNGTVRVPDDHENARLELDRKNSVTDHELTHTLQAIRTGPLLLSYIPVFVFECLTDFVRVNGPTMSDYVAGTLNGTVLTGTGLQANDSVQVAQNGRATSISVGAAKDGGFELSESARQALATRNIQDGAVMVRRSLQSGGLDKANKIFEWISNISQFLTLGFATNLVTFLGWAGLINWIIQFISWIASSSPHGVSATLSDDQKTLTIATGSSLDGLSATSSLSVKGGDQTFIRAVSSVNGNTVVLQQSVPLIATVEISLYTLGSAMFGGARNFFPASVPDTNKPAVMKLRSVGSDHLTLNLRDRIEIRTPSGSSFQTLVAAVNGDEVTVEQEALLQQGQVNDFLVAKVKTEDAHWMEDFLINAVRMGWMNYVNDPYAQFTRRFEPHSMGGRITTSSLRYLLGTHSWMPLFAGYFWFDNAYKRPKGHLSGMEQEASHKSGDTYCPIGSLHGSPSVVGDVGRYWLTENGGLRYGSNNGQPGGTPQDLILLAPPTQDAPGVNFAKAPVLSLGPATSPKFSTVAALPADSVPSDFYQVSGTGVFQDIGPRGWVPVSPRLERSAGIQVAFSLPNDYKVTAKAAGNGIFAGDITDSDEAQAAGASLMTFPITVSDVIAHIATLDVAEGATVTLIPFQRAAMDVSPNGSRVYRPTPADPGFVVDVSGSDLVANATVDTDDVEISRFHKFDPTTNSFDSGITPMHLPDDLDIAVRRIQVQVITTIPFRSADLSNLKLTDPPLANVHAGETALLLVPAQIAPVPTTTIFAPVGAPINPQLAPLLDTDIPDALKPTLQAFLRDGGGIKFTFQDNEPPEDTTTMTATVHVGLNAASSVAVTAKIEVDPYFTLGAGGSAFKVAKGDTNGITLQSSDATQLTSDTSIAGVTVTPDHDKVNVVVDAAYAGPATIIILVHDTAPPPPNTPIRTARRTLKVT